MKSPPPNPLKDILPVKQSQHQTQRYYDRLSRWYDLFSGSTERGYTLQGLDMLNLQSGETVLEIGFGTGYALLAISRAVEPDGQVQGIELSPGMIAQTRARLSQQNPESKIQLTCGDAAHLPYAGASLDAVFLSFTLELFDTPVIPIVLAECLRTLKNGGRLAAVPLPKPDQSHPGVTIYEWIHRRFPGALDCRPIPAQRFIEQAGFEIHKSSKPTLLGILPLEIILGRKIQSPTNLATKAGCSP